MRLSSLLIALSSTLAIHGSAQAIDLLQSYQQAKLANPTLLATQAQTEADKQEVNIAFAQMLPNLSWSMTRYKNDLESTTKNIFGQTSTSTADYFSYNKNLSLRQAIFRPQLYFNLKQAHATAEASEAKLSHAEQTLAVQVCEAYFRALTAQEELNYYAAAAATTQALIRSAQQSFEKGFGTLTDIDDAQTKRDITLAQQLDAEQNLAQAKSELESLIGQEIPVLNRFAFERLSITPPTDSLQTWQKKAEENNYQLKSQLASIDAAGQDFSKQRANHLPTVDLIAQKANTQSDNPISSSVGYQNTVVGFQINVPIFAGGYTSASAEQARFMLEKNKRQYDALRQETLLNTRKEYHAMLDSAAKARAYEQAEKSANRLIVSVTKSLQAGVKTLLDKFNAEQQLMSVRRDLANARLQYVLSHLRLQALAGELSEQSIRDVNAYLTTD